MDNKQVKVYLSKKARAWMDTLDWGTKSSQVNAILEAYIDAEAKTPSVAEVLGKIYLAITALPAELGQHLSFVASAPMSEPEAEEENMAEAADVANMFQ